MADPVTLGVGALAIGGAYQSSKAQKQQARAQADSQLAQQQQLLDEADIVEDSAKGIDAQAQASAYNAALAQQNAALTYQQAAEAERRYRVQARKDLGEIRARYGASGVTLDGSAMDVLMESARNAELNALTIRHEGDVKALAFTNEAALHKFTAAAATERAADVRTSAEQMRSRAPAYSQSARSILKAGDSAATATLLSAGASVAGKYVK